MEKYDTAFLGILQNEGKLSNFLDAVFSFLSRRTDFYLHMRHEKDTMGFPPGVAKKIVLATYQKYENQFKERNEMRMQEYQASLNKCTVNKPAVTKPTKPESSEAQASNTTPEEAMDTAPYRDSQNSCGSNKNQNTSSDVSQKTESSYPAGDQANKGGVQEAQSAGDISSESSSSAAEGQKPPDKSDSQSNGISKSSQNDDEDNPELARQQSEFQKNDESYNGAQRDNFSWSQTISEVDARIKIPKYIRRGKEVQVDMQRKHLKVAHKDLSGGWTTVLDDDLTWEVHKDECIWSLIPAEHVHVSLEKVQERWWEALLESEPRISVRKIDASRPMTDLDDEAQAKIQEMMYNENQKHLGKPQSHEQKVHSMLDNAWDAEGSPFKGQPFDPSKLNISSAGTGASSIDFSKMAPPST